MTSQLSETELLFNSFFNLTVQENAKLSIDGSLWGDCTGHSDGFPSQCPTNPENVPTSFRPHLTGIYNAPS